MIMNILYRDLLLKLFMMKILKKEFLWRMVVDGNEELIIATQERLVV